MKKSDILAKFNLSSDVSFSSALHYNFVINHSGDSIVTNFKIEERTSSYLLMKKIQDNFFPQGCKFTILGGSSISLVCLVEDKKENFLGYYIVTDTSSDVEYGRAPENALQVKTGKFEITFVLDFKIFDENISKLFEEYFPSIKRSKVNWYYMKDGRQQIQEIPIEDENVIHDEFYPYIEGGVHKLMEDYFNSRESILLMLGPPGTGKTSLLRHMIVKNKFHACMTYDKGIFMSDNYYLSYLLGDQNDLLVVEDADVLLEDRTTAGNEMMSKLLNIGDGLVKMPNKKMIFTTNLTDVRKIDAAIMRPGRCFGVVTFRNLYQKEAEKVCEIANLPPPEGKKEYSIADCFSRKKVVNIRRFGFV